MSARSVVPPARWPAPSSLLVAALVAVGAVARLRVVLFPAEELFRSFPSEDGYLMLTVARSLSLGLGMTHAAGNLATNGVQPLATLLQAVVFSLAGSSREAGVRLLVLAYAGVTALTALLIFRLARRLGEGEGARRAAILAAAVWFASPVLLFRSMNMLETGLYTLLVVGVVLAFARGHARAGDGPWPARRSIGMGVLLALSFWARNDAVLLMGAVAVAHLATRAGAASWRRRLRELAIMAATTMALSLPWVLYGLLRFGSVVPVSGLAHMGTTSPGASLAAAGVALFEMLTMVVSLEHGPHPQGAVEPLAIGGAVALAVVLLARGLWRARSRRAIFATWLVPAVLGSGLVVFYCFGFDAPYFLRRYLYPLSPFLAIVWAGLAVRLPRALAPRGLRAALVPAALVLLGSFVVGDGLLLPRGPWRRAQFQGVDWIAANVDEQTWVGAFQSGTVGFFHDRTINLDGKLNPDALRAIRAGRHAEYAVGSPIEVLVDWATILEPWYRSRPELRRAFEWVVLDREHDFAVLRRRANR